MSNRIRENTKVSVIDPQSAFYGRRGVVTAVERDADGQVTGFVCSIDGINGGDGARNATTFRPEQIDTVIKKFMDIERLVESDEEVAEGIIKKRNCDNFVGGLNIQISEKIDGANASFRFNVETGRVAAFSRNNELAAGNNGLRGFYEYVMSHFRAEDFKAAPFCNYVFFGEWLVPHTVKYDKGRYDSWYVYDVYDSTSDRYLPQSEVRALCGRFGLEYVHVLYEGPFVSWDHVRSFMNSPAYGPKQEGVVVKLQCGDVSSVDPSQPRVLKLVNNEYLETKHVKKSIREAKTPEQLAEEALALERMESIVTAERVQKEMHKCRDEGLIPAEVGPSDMGTLLKLLPKRIYEDCIKEEPETLAAAGERAGKLCSKLVLSHLRAMVLGI